MPRIIDADKLKAHYAWWDNEYKKIFDTIVDLQPDAVRHGWWIAMPIDDEELYKCSECGDKEYYTCNYCPNCGARMDEESEDERKTY